jgi:hypothetical protein
MLIESLINLGISVKLGTPRSVLDIYEDVFVITKYDLAQPSSKAHCGIHQCSNVMVVCQSV